MRRPLFMLPAPVALAALAALGALGCEDGPTQTYSASPPDAGSIWNSGNVAPAAPDGGQQFDAGYPTVSKTVICDTDYKRQRWAWMLTQQIQPPRLYGGLDMALNDQWDGLTIDIAEQRPTSPTDPKPGLCQSVPAGFQGTCPSGFGGCNGNYWGNNAEVFFSWNVATHVVDQMQLQLGYTGAMATGMYPDHNGEMHSYSIAIGDVVRRDGQAWEILWNDSKQRAIQITDVFNATMATFAPKAGVPFDQSVCTVDHAPSPNPNNLVGCDAPGTSSICECAHDPANPGQCMAGTTGKCGISNCGSDGNCLIYNDGSATIFGIRPMVIYFGGTAGVPQPALSTPQYIYNFFSKWEPFSNLPQVVKLDAEGPVATGTPVGVPATAATTCTQKVGQTFDDFKTNCVQVHGDSGQPNSVDDVNLNKVTHSLTHDQEHWTANVLGVNQNFTSSKVANNPALVVLDTDQPGMGDVAQDWTFDVRARGAVANDYGACTYTASGAGDAACAKRYGASSKCVYSAPFPPLNPKLTSTFGYCSGADIYHPGPVPTLHGSALVMIEWARLLLADIARILNNPTPTVLGDPNCTYGKFAAGCSGIEGMIIPNSAATYGGPGVDFTNDASCSASSTVPCLDPGANADQYGIFVSILKPGDSYSAFCVDPGSEQDCTADFGVSMFQNALNHVKRMLGNGNLDALPPELQDRRYYYKWFGIAYVKYLKAYGNYAKAHGASAGQFPDGTGVGMGPTDVMNQQIDLESLFFDYTVSPGAGGAQTFDKFEYIDRDFNGTGSGGTSNWIPWDFEYGNDLFGGNQRYDNWYRRMDREEIALYSAMLTDKTHTAGQENNVNITNLFGSVMLGGDPVSAVSGIWPSYACAIGQGGDPAKNCGGVNAPLDWTLPSGPQACDQNGGGCGGTVDTVQASCATTATACTKNSDCAAVGAHGGTCTAGGHCKPACGAPFQCDPTTKTCLTNACTGGPSYENGYVQACGNGCDFVTYAKSGCASATQTCVPNGAGGACIDMMMDKNGPGAANPHSLLWYYPGVWSKTPFHRGHSPITLAQADKQPNIGVTKITIPNFVTDPANPYTTGPYTYSPVLSAAGVCPTGYTASANTVWCNAALNTGTDCGVANPPSPLGTAACNKAPTFHPLVPWAEVQPGIGFSIPLDAQHNQWVSSGQFDFTGVLETYIVDYVPYVDIAKASCVTDGVCNKGFKCNAASHACETDDDTVSISAIEGADFLGQAFLCQDPTTGDVLHVGMYDSGVGILSWLANHPGSESGGSITPSAQAACQILVIRSPYDNYVDYIVSKTNGVFINVGGGQGQGRVTDVVLFDPSLIQSL